MKKLLVSFLFSTFGIALFIPQTHALGIMPFKFDLEGKPGSEFDKEIVLQNDNDYAIEVEAIVQDFVALDDSGRQKFLNPFGDPVPTSMHTWVKLPEPFVMEAGETKNVSISVNIPDDATTGGKYAAIIFHQKSEGSGDLAVSSGIACLLLTTVLGDDLKPEGRIQSFTLAENEKGESVFDVVIQNTGNVHIKPIGHIVVGDTEAEFNPGLGNVLPDQSRKFQLRWSEKLDIENTQATVYAKVGYKSDSKSLGFTSEPIKVDDSSGEEVVDSEAMESDKPVESIDAVKESDGVASRAVFFVIAALVIMMALYSISRSNKS